MGFIENLIFGVVLMYVGYWIGCRDSSTEIIGHVMIYIGGAILFVAVATKLGLLNLA